MAGEIARHFSPVHERYHRDPAFRQLVDVLELQIRQLKLTPTEVREAAVLACVHYEQHTYRRTYVIPCREADAIEPPPPPPGAWRS